MIVYWRELDSMRTVTRRGIALAICAWVLGAGHLACSAVSRPSEASPYELDASCSCPWIEILCVGPCERRCSDAELRDAGVDPKVSCQLPREHFEPLQRAEYQWLADPSAEERQRVCEVSLDRIKERLRRGAWCKVDSDCTDIDVSRFAAVPCHVAVRRDHAELMMTISESSYEVDKLYGCSSVREVCGRPGPVHCDAGMCVWMQFKK